MVIKQSLAPVSNNPFNFTPFIVISTDEGLRNPTLHNPGFDSSDAANNVLSDDFLEFLLKILHNIQTICLHYLS